MIAWGDVANLASVFVRDASLLFVIGVFAILFFGRKLNMPVSNFAQHPRRSAFTGILSILILLLLLLPLLNVLTAFILPLAQLSGVAIFAQSLHAVAVGFETSFIGFIQLLILYGGRVILALVIGWKLTPYLIRSRINHERTAMLMSLFFGALIITLVSFIPMIGLSASIVGFGAITSPLLWRNDHFRLTSTIMAMLGRSPEMIILDLPAKQTPTNKRVAAPPIPTDPLRSPGTENLPEGFNFKWWED